MDTSAPRNTTHPMILIAALSVTLLSAAGIAAIMGWIPASNSQQAATVVAVAPADCRARQTGGTGQGGGGTQGDDQIRPCRSG